MANFEIIRDLAESRRVTLRSLASRVGISPGQLQEIIRRGSTNTTTAEKIAGELGVSAGIFFDDPPAGIGNVTNTGNISSSAIGAGNTVSLCTDELKSAREEISALTERLANTVKEIDYLRSIIEEKERLIQILIKQ